MLGVVTEITLRLLPLPPARATLSAAFATLPQAAAAVQAIFAAGFLPSALEIADHFTLEAARRDSGRGDCARGQRAFARRSRWQQESVRSEAAAIRELIEMTETKRLQMASGEADCEKLWALRRAVQQFAPRDRPNEIKRGRGRSAQSFGRSDGVRRKLQAKHGFPIACFGHAGDGNIHVNIMADRYNRDAAVREKVERALDDLFAQVLAWGGVITGEHGIGLAKKRWWPEATSEVARELHRRVKQVLDPDNILNPGKFV